MSSSILKFYILYIIIFLHNIFIYIYIQNPYDNVGNYLQPQPFGSVVDEVKNNENENNCTFLPAVISKCEEYAATTTDKQKPPD